MSKTYLFVHDDQGLGQRADYSDEDVFSVHEGMLEILRFNEEQFERLVTARHRNEDGEVEYDESWSRV